MKGKLEEWISEVQTIKIKKALLDFENFENEFFVLQIISLQTVLLITIFNIEKNKISKKKDRPNGLKTA